LKPQTWHKWLKEGRDNVEDDETRCRQRYHRTDENVENVWDLVYSDRSLRIRSMAMQLNLGKETVTCAEKACILAQRLNSPP